MIDLPVLFTLQGKELQKDQIACTTNLKGYKIKKFETQSSQIQIHSVYYNTRRLVIYFYYMMIYNVQLNTCQLSD